MKIKRRTKIITETERKISFAITKNAPILFCDNCGKQTEMLSINEAVGRLKKPWTEIVRLIEDFEIHSFETSDGEIYICAKSLEN